MKLEIQAVLAEKRAIQKRINEKREERRLAKDTLEGILNDLGVQLRDSTQTAEETAR